MVWKNVYFVYFINIKLVTYYDEDKLLNPITAKQKKIFKALDISYENIFKVGH